MCYRTPIEARVCRDRTACPNPSEARYLHYKDKASRSSWTYFLKRKPDAGTTVGRFVVGIHDSTKLSFFVGWVRFDCGDETRATMLRHVLG